MSVAATATPTAPATPARTRNGLGPIGLDAGERTVCATQVRWETGQARLHALVVLPRIKPGTPLDADEMRRLCGVLRRQGFGGRRIVAGLPDDKLMVNTFEQAGSGPPPEVVARVELARHAGCAPTHLETACWTLPASASRAKQGAHVLAIGCLHADADAVLDIIESPGLRADALEPRALALVRACGPVLAARPGIAAAVDLGWEAVTAAVLYQGTIVYQRSIPELGVSALARAVMTATGVDAQAAAHLLRRSARGGSGHSAADVSRLIGEHAVKVSQELGRALSYASHWYAEPQIGLVALAGEGAAGPEVEAVLARELGTEVRTVTPRDLAGEIGPHDASTNPAAVVALGLAMREVG
jgi:hypothetical protein